MVHEDSHLPWLDADSKMLSSWYCDGIKLQDFGVTRTPEIVFPNTEAGNSRCSLQTRDSA